MNHQHKWTTSGHCVGCDTKFSDYVEERLNNIDKKLSILPLKITEEDVTNFIHRATEQTLRVITDFLRSTD